MPNKKINQLDTRTGAALTDLILIGDPTSGTSFKLTATAFRTLLNNVPYTGATTNVNLGAFNLTAASIIRTGGTSSQFLKADGSIDSSVYYLASNPVGYITGITSGNVTTALGYTPVPTTRTLTINGTSFDLSSDRSWTIAAGITGSGVAGQVAYWNGTNSQTGSNNLFWDAANSRLGIGTNSPAYRLHNVGTSAFDQGASGDAITILNGGYISMASTRFRAINTQFQFQDNAYNIKVLLNTSNSVSYFNSGGNYVFGGFTDGGQRLQVQGDAFIKGSGATSATTGLTVQDSGGLNLFRIRNDGRLDIGTNGGETCIQPTQNGTTTNKDGRGLIYSVAGMIGAQAAHTFTVNGGILNGGGYLMRLSTSFSPTTGSVDTTFLWVTPTINQTGGTHITRGLYVNPTLTAAADWRSIEWSNNSGWGLYGAGTANNYLAGKLVIGTTTVSTFLLDVNGTARVSGVFTQAGANNANLGYITNTGTVGVASNTPGAGTWGMIIGCVANGGDTAIFTKGNNSGATAIRITDQNIGASRNHFLVDFNGASGFNLPNGTTTVSASAQVEIVSTTKGFLPPRMTTSQKTSIASPAAGLQVYDTTLNQMSYYNGTTWINF